MDTAKAHWLIENWERTGSNGNPQQMSFKWELKDAAISIHMPSRFMKSYGVVGLTRKAVKLLASLFGRRGYSDTERSYSQFVHPCTPRPGNETVNDTSSTGGAWPECRWIKHPISRVKLQTNFKKQSGILVRHFLNYEHQQSSRFSRIRGVGNW